MAPALISQLAAYAIEDHLRLRITDFIHHCIQHAALNGILSSPLPVKARVCQDSVFDSVLFFIFINDLLHSLENPAYLFAGDSTLCRIISHPSDRQAVASSLSANLDRIRIWSHTWNTRLSTPTNPHTQPVSPKGPSSTPSHLLPKQPLERLSLKLSGFTISHDLSSVDHISKMASKASS